MAWVKPGRVTLSGGLHQCSRVAFVDTSDGTVGAVGAAGRRFVGDTSCQSLNPMSFALSIRHYHNAHSTVESTEEIGCVQPRGDRALGSEDIG